MALILRDVDIRPALRSRLLGEHVGESDTVILEELGIQRGRVRIDLAVVNGLVHGYEIKSDRDNLHRLPTQVELYGAVLDRATLVVGDRHVEAAVRMIPSWWGVIHVRHSGESSRFTVVRRGRRNRGRNARTLVEWLWRDTAIDLLREHDRDRGIHGKPRRIIWDRVCESVSLDQIAEAVRAQLKARQGPTSPAPQL